jgi:hypothetical protein
MQTDRSALQKTKPAILFVWLLLFPMAFFSPGCRWMSADEAKVEEESEEDEEAKPKSDFELQGLVVLPSTLEKDDDEEPLTTADAEFDLPEDSIYGSASSLSRTAVKPGHWVHVRHKLLANNFDFVGDLTARSLDRDMNSISLERSPFRVVSSRPMSLPKEQSKYVDVPLYVPKTKAADGKLTQIGSELKSRNGARVVDFGGQPTVRLNSHQFFLMVLSEEPERYGYLKTMTVVQPPEADETEWDAMPGDYAVKFINAEQPLPLPSGGLTWTSTAYVVWDGLDPDLFSTDQQTAMLDWLHWGGRLILSGPQTLERLRGSFLEPYLPATAGRTLTVDQEVIDSFNEHWQVLPRNPQRDPEHYLLSLNRRPLEVIELQLNEGGRFLENTSELVAERRVGRGLMVATSFALTERRIVNWPGFDSFFNGCLMRRSPRKFTASDGMDSVSWMEKPTYRDARETSPLRFFVRDAAGQRNDIDLSLPRDAKLGDGYRTDSVAGIAGWSDFSEAATAARDSLESSAGIEVPNRKFVAKMLGGYLLCLVPLNWLLFRLMGRVEWAWIAAPLIAIMGGIGIVKMAELDIGFVRSRTEVAVVELQEGYDRAHVARYTGFYTSLTSDYAVRFDDPTAVTAPFSANAGEARLRMQRQEDVLYRQDDSVGLSGFPVISNSTGMVHSEQFVVTDGKLELLAADGALQLANGTGFELQGSIVLHRESERECKVAIVGDLETGGTVLLDFENGDGSLLTDYLNEESATAATNRESGNIGLRELVQLAAAWSQIEVGGYRLVGWNASEVPGMTVSPKSNQSNFRTLFVANLSYPQLAAPASDRNLFEEFRAEEPIIFDDSSLGEQTTP